MTCPHRFDVEVYVLGALDPAERDTFEAHLDGCAECARSLRAVAGLPGLLARAPAPDRPPASGLDDPGPDPPPAELLDGVLRRVRRRRAATRVVAAAVVALALLAGVAVAGLTGSGSPSPPAVRELALPAVAGSESSGLAGLVARPWGTQVSLTCRYEGESRPTPAPEAPRTTYVLVVRGPDGREQQIARWSPPPGQDVTVTAATDLPADQVGGLEVRTVSGDVVMRS